MRYFLFLDTMIVTRRLGDILKYIKGLEKELAITYLVWCNVGYLKGISFRKKNTSCSALGTYGMRCSTESMNETSAAMYSHWIAGSIVYSLQPFQHDRVPKRVAVTMARREGGGTIATLIFLNYMMKVKHSTEHTVHRFSAIVRNPIEMLCGDVPVCF